MGIAGGNGWGEGMDGGGNCGWEFLGWEMVGGGHSWGGGIFLEWQMKWLYCDIVGVGNDWGENWLRWEMAGIKNSCTL